jgi:GNAT superfamily N-acetyltransferase
MASGGSVSTLKLQVEDASEDVVTVIGNGLRRYNESQRETFGRSEFVVTVRNASNLVVGGARCLTGEAMLFVQWLWIDDAARGGTSRDVMAIAEEEGKRRGCLKVYLDTFSFQARGFYEKLGYEVFGTLTFPQSHIMRHYMSKDLI